MPVSRLFRYRCIGGLARTLSGERGQLSQIRWRIIPSSSTSRSRTT